MFPRLAQLALAVCLLVPLCLGIEPFSAAQASDLVAQGFELLSRNDVAGAEAAFRKAIDAQPEAAAAHRGLGLALRARGQWEAALGELQVVTRLDPKDPDAHYDLGMVAWSLSTQPTRSRGTGGRLSPSDYRVLAADEFSKALFLRPQDASMRVALAELYLDAGKSREALVQAQDAVRLAPENAAAHVTLGRVYFAGGEEEKAAAEFEAALKVNAGEGGAHLALGQLRLFQRKSPQAEEEFRRAIQVSPDLAPAYAALAGILAEDGRGAEARTLLEKAVALDPNDWHSQVQLAAWLNQAGETGRATELLEKVSRAHPDFLPAREQLALGLLRRGDLKGASSQAEALIALDPQAAEGHRVMALLLWKQHDYETSLAECAMAISSDPNSPSMLALQAIELWQLGRKKEAQGAFRQAAKIEPKVGTSEIFCRLLWCDARDIGAVAEFLRKNRWVIAPTPTP